MKFWRLHEPFICKDSLKIQKNEAEEEIISLKVFSFTYSQI